MVKQVNTTKRNKTWLAEFLGVNQSRISHLIAQKRIPNKDTYTVKEANAAKAMLQQARSVANGTAGRSVGAESVGTYRHEQIGKLREQRLLYRLRRRREAGELIARTEVEERNVRKVSIVKNRLMELPALSYLLAGKDEFIISQHLEDWARTTCGFFESGPERYEKEPPIEVDLESGRAAGVEGGGGEAEGAAAAEIGAEAVSE
jgi:hypothetical protein